MLQFQNPDADSFNRIVAFSSVKVVGEQPGSADMGVGMGFAFIRGVEFSVQPASTEFSNWLAGNGDWDGTWMHGKSLFVGIRSTDEYFQLVVLGSG